MTRTARATIAALTALAAVAAIIAADFTPPASAQSDDETAGRIVARLLDDGRVEFGWQPTGGERVLPRSRYFPTDATVDRWLRSSPVEVGGAEIGRINARLLEDGRIEFAFTPTDGERITPQARYFPTDARVGRWLRSTEIAIGPAHTGYTAVSAGSFHTCAIRIGSGAIECWGSNYFGQADPPDGEFVAVSARNVSTCAIRTNRKIECWGSNKFGQADAPDGSYTAVSAGDFHTCAIRDTGDLACWGSNLLHIQIHAVEAGAIDAPDGRYTTISAGTANTCAIHERDSAIECWGSNGEPYLWDPYANGSLKWRIGKTGKSDAPSGSYVAVSAGHRHTCAIRTSDSAIECWGRNGDYVRDGAGEWQLIRKTGQTDVPDGSYTAVSAGDLHTCGLRADGELECWGDNRHGQSDAPDGRFTAVTAGDLHTCAIRESGAIACWGWNRDGQTDAPTD